MKSGVSFSQFDGYLTKGEVVYSLHQPRDVRPVVSMVAGMGEMSWMSEVGGMVEMSWTSELGGRGEMS